MRLCERFCLLKTGLDRCRKPILMVLGVSSLSFLARLLLLLNEDADGAVAPC